MNDKAATQNSKIIAEHNYDLTKVINAFSNSHMAYGSEFRNHAILDKLLHKSPHWLDVKRSLSKGSRYPLERINNRRRHQDLQDAVKRGNHKFTKTNLPKLIEIVDGEVQRGFQLPITVASVFKIPHARMHRTVRHGQTNNNR